MLSRLVLYRRTYMMEVFTLKQRKFIETYCGNATEAAIAAGYSSKTARSQGQRLLTNVDILKAVKEREKADLALKVANRQERQEFWTSAMKDTELPMRDRLKASELLGRSEADFKERIEIQEEIRPCVHQFDLDERIRLIKA